MSEAVTQAKAQFNRAKDRLTLLLAKTPDNRLNWSPSETCRTPLQQVAHSALAISGIQGMLQGKPFPYESMAQLDTAIRAAEKEFTTREQALSLLEKNSSEYFAWLDSLTVEQLAAITQLPFGAMPLAVAISFPTDHTRGHAAQLEYIHTVYGDHDWYFS